MKWELINCLGYQFTFEIEGEGHELKVFAKTVDEAVRKAKSLVREGAEFDVSGWDEE